MTSTQTGRPAAVATFFSDLRRRSQLGLYALGGLLGGLTGLALGLLAVVIVKSAVANPTSSSMSESFKSVLLISVGIGTFTGAVGTALCIAMFWYQRKKIGWLRVVSIALLGFASGAVCAGVFQALFNGITDSHTEVSFVVIIASVIMTGALLGASLSRNAPNLSPMRGLISGLLAGTLSSAATTAAYGWGIGAPGFYLLGLTVFGLTMGLAMALAEGRFRDKSVDVEWEPNAITRFGLGTQPVRIGGGNDDVFIKGAPAHISSITVTNGQIEHVETAGGKRTPLDDGSRLRINGVTMVVHAKGQGK